VKRIFIIGFERKLIDNRAHGFTKWKRGDFPNDAVEEAISKFFCPLVFGERKRVIDAPGATIF
jgi:hypothetical protein